MKAKALPPLEVLEAKFVYDCETGVVTYRETTNPRAKKGQCVGWKNSKGYLIVQIEKTEYLLHRVIYALHYKQTLQPDDVIDHINRNPQDNRIENLRKVTKAGNNYNQKLRHNNTSGQRGVYYSNSKNKWVAKLGSRQLGCYLTKDEAISARMTAEMECKVIICDT